MEAYREPIRVKPVYETNFPDATLLKRGKVRDVYDAGKDLVIVSTDRLSAFDVVFPDPIPWKGIVLNQLSAFWFNRTRHIIGNHLVSTSVRMLPDGFQEHRDLLEGRVSLVEEAEQIPLECVVRGYLTGSGWDSYVKKGEVCGIPLRKGLKKSERLDEPIFTPTTKESNGHDRPVNANEAAEIVGSKETFEKLEEHSIRLFNFGAEYALKKGIIIADTKFEYGTVNGEIRLTDEALTPDSSRFWPVESYVVGENPPSYDKQFVRDYVKSIGWNEEPPAPRLTQEVIDGTTHKYLEAYERITGRELYQLVKARRLFDEQQARGAVAYADASAADALRQTKRPGGG
jgi:phosphoribosylaminoimidazole-succinocarboxamide synthase